MEGLYVILAGILVMALFGLIVSLIEDYSKKAKS